VDYLPPELARLLGALDGIAERLNAVCEKLAVGVDPLGTSAGVKGGDTWEIVRRSAAHRLEGLDLGIVQRDLQRLHALRPYSVANDAAEADKRRRLVGQVLHHVR
jgi:hypothetical protein